MSRVGRVLSSNMLQSSPVKVGNLIRVSSSTDDLDSNVLERGGEESMDPASGEAESVLINRIHNEQSDEPGHSGLSRDFEQK